MTLASVVVVSLASGCLGAPFLGNDGSSSDSDSSTSSTSSGTTVADTSGTDGTSGTSGATTATGGTADSGSSDTGPLVCEPLEGVESIPAILEVTVEILNDTAEPVYLVDFPYGCTEYAVARDGRNLPFRFGYSCPCECGPPEAEVFPVALDPGQSLVLTWDGRVMVLYTQSFHCEWEGPGGVEEWCDTGTTAAFQPLAPGPITMTIPIYDEEASYEQGRLDSPYELLICQSPRSFTVDFELGAEDLTIPVALSEVVIR